MDVNTKQDDTQSELDSLRKLCQSQKEELDQLKTEIQKLKLELDSYWV